MAAAVPVSYNPILFLNFEQSINQVINYVATIIIDIKTINELNEMYGTFIPLPILGWIFQAAVTLFVLYPMASFIREVKTGIMAPETYPREEYSCCCTTTRKY
jgi:hypothetical protein